MNIDRLRNIRDHADSFRSCDYDTGTVALSRLVVALADVLIEDREDERVEDALNRIFGGTA